jgi:2,3-dihydroxybenzoate-AMP ligase
VPVAVARDGSGVPTLEDLRPHARERLAAYKLPEAMVVVPELPLTPGEKVDRAALRGLLPGPSGAPADTDVR